MRRKVYIKTISQVAMLSLLTGIIFASILSGKFIDGYSGWDTYEDQQLYESLRAQGYDRKTATDEVWEQKGYPDRNGTGGIDGICKYGTMSPNGPINEGGKGGSSTQATTSTSSTPAHAHSWNEGVVTKESTCSAEGEITYSCECGKTRTEKLPKLEHTYVMAETKATCTEYRKETYTCTVCGDSLSFEYPEEGYSDHIFIPTEDSIDADCENAGLTIYICAACGEKKEEEVPALGHEFTQYTMDKEPDCVNKGEKSIYCDRCGVMQEGSTVEIDALGHKENPKHEITPASFWKDGLETVYCERCGEKLSENILSAEGGVWRNIIPIAGGVVLVAAVIMIIALKKKR